VSHNLLVQFRVGQLWRNLRATKRYASKATALLLLAGLPAGSAYGQTARIVSLETSSPAWHTGDPPMAISDTLQVKSDSENISSATVQITGGPFTNEDVLSANVAGTGLTATANPAWGAFTITGKAPPATYQTVLRSLTYTNAAAIPNTNPRLITITVTDGAFTSPPVTRTLNIERVLPSTAFFSVASYGAVGDGVHDDGPAIAQAVNATVAASAAGQIAELDFDGSKAYYVGSAPSGGFAINLTGANNVRIAGSGCTVVTQLPVLFLNVSHCTSVAVSGFHVATTPSTFLAWTVKSKVDLSTYTLQLNSQYAALPADTEIDPGHVALDASNINAPAQNVSITHIDAVNDAQKIVRMTSPEGNYQPNILVGDTIVTQHPLGLAGAASAPIAIVSSGNVQLKDIDTSDGLQHVVNVTRSTGPVTLKRVSWAPRTADHGGNGVIAAYSGLGYALNRGSLTIEDCSLLNPESISIPTWSAPRWNNPASSLPAGTMSELLMSLNAGGLSTTPLVNVGDTIIGQTQVSYGEAIPNDHAKVVATANQHVVLDHQLSPSLSAYLLEDQYPDAAVIRRTTMPMLITDGPMTIEASTITNYAGTSIHNDFIGNTFGDVLNITGYDLFQSGSSWLNFYGTTMRRTRQTEIWDTVLGGQVDEVNDDAAYVYDQDNGGAGEVFIFNPYTPHTTYLATDPSYVTGVSLINFDTNQPIPGYDPIQNNQVIPLATLPTKHLNLRANVSGAFDSVTYDSNSQLPSEIKISTNSTSPYYINPLGWAHDDVRYSIVAYPNHGTLRGRGQRVKFRVAGLLPGWNTVSIGAAPPPTPGSAYQIGNVLTMSGAGGDTGGTADNEQFVYQNKSMGPGPNYIFDQVDMVAKVTSQAAGSPDAKAGLQFRDSADPAAASITLAVTPGNLIVFQRRYAAGGPTTTLATAPYPSLPCWLRLRRYSGSIYAYSSPDGINWKQIGTDTTAAFPPVAMNGVVVSSNDANGLPSTATFENVALSNPIPGWWASDIGGLPPADPVQYRPDAFSLSAGPGSFANSPDNVSLAYQQIAGDSIVQARTWDVGSESPNAMGGVIMRPDLDNFGQYFGVFLTADGNIVQQWRSTAHGGTLTSAPKKAPGQPLWLRITRVGDTFTGYYSMDRLAWNTISSKNITGVASNIASGVALAGNGATAKADFETIGTSGVAPSPTITYLVPNAAPAGSAGFKLIISGSGFSRLSTVSFGSDTSLYPTFVDENTLTVNVPATDLVTAGMIKIAVTNPAPGGGNATAAFTIGAVTGSKLTGTPISSPPAASFPAANAFDGNVNTEFKSISTSGGWVGMDLGRIHKVITAIQLHNPAGDLISGGSFQGANKKDFSDAVTLATNTNPDSPTYVTGIGDLNSYRYVRYLAKPGTYCVAGELEFDGGYPPVPLPTLTSLSRSYMAAGSANTTIGLTGTNFKPASTVFVNGTLQACAYNSATSLSVTLTKAQFAASGSITLQVVNPAPNGGSSNVIELPVVTQPKAGSFTISAASVTGGTPLTATLTLSAPATPGGMTVTFASNNAAAVVPSTQFLTEGQTAVTISLITKPVNAATNCTVTANVNGSMSSANLKVLPPVLSAVSVSPTPVKGGTVAKITVTLTGNSGPSGLSVALTASDNTTIPPGTTVMVPAGTASAVYTFTPPATAADKTITIKATGGGVVKSTSLTISAPVLTALATSTAAPRGGQAVTIKVTISTPAPSAGLKVTLTSSSASLPVTPGYITVPAGALIGSLMVTPKTVTASTPVTLTAKLNAVTLTKALTVMP